MQGHAFGRDAGAAVGQHVRQIDDLEAFDHADQHDGRGARRDAGPGDVAEDAPARGAVELGRLHLLARLPFDGREQHDEHEGRPLPGVRQEHDPARRPRTLRPGEGAQTEGAGDRRQRADRHVGQHAEGVGHADRRDHQRQEEAQPEEVAAADVLRAQHRQSETQAELQPGADDDVEQRRDERARLSAAAGRREHEHEQRQGDAGGEQPAEPAGRGHGRDEDMVQDESDRQQAERDAGEPGEPRRIDGLDPCRDPALERPDRCQQRRGGQRAGRRQRCPGGASRRRQRAQRAREAPPEQQHGGAQQGPRERADLALRAEEVELLRAEQQPAVVERAGEREVDAARLQREARHRQQRRQPDREDRERQDDRDRRREEQAVGVFFPETQCDPMLARYAACCLALPTSLVISFHWSSIDFIVAFTSISPARKRASAVSSATCW